MFPIYSRTFNLATVIQDYHVYNALGKPIKDQNGNHLEFGNIELKSRCKSSTTFLTHIPVLRISWLMSSQVSIGT